jgi:PEP-CTERM motif
MEVGVAGLETHRPWRAGLPLPTASTPPRRRLRSRILGFLLASSKIRIIINPCASTQIVDVDGSPHSPHCHRHPLLKEDELMKAPAMILVALALLLSGMGQAKAGLINFDVDANGNPIQGYSSFGGSALTDLYAPLGVHFSGPGKNDGGAILDQVSNFGVNARSGSNFLGFHSGGTYPNGGAPIGPETISFDTPQSAVSLFASGGSNSDMFVLDAFDSNNVLVTTSGIQTALAGEYTQLSVAGQGIRKVVLTELGSGLFVADDLSFTAGTSAVPEPATLTLLGFGIAGLAGYGWRRRKQAVVA